MSLICVNCGSRAVTSLEAPFDEDLVFDAPSAGTHTVSIGWDIDPARLMGWSNGGVQYQALVDVSAGGVSKTIWLPITDEHDVIRDGKVVGRTFREAGDPLPDGYTRVRARRAITFKADGAPIVVHTRVSSGASKMPLKTIRTLRVEIKGPEWIRPAGASDTRIQ